MSNLLNKDMLRIKSGIHDFEKLENKTIMVTGSTGMIATYLVHFFMFLNKEYDAKINVIALARNGSKANNLFKSYLSNDSFEILVQDVASEIKYDGKIDYIYHLASSASPTAMREDPIGIIKANTLGTMNVMELAKKSETKKVIFSSSREVYGKIEDKLEIFETDFGYIDPLDKRSAYPESKKMSEAIITSYHSQYNIDFAIARIAHVYGPGMNINNDGRIMSDLIYYVSNGKNIELLSDGKALRAFCYLTDAVTALIILLINDASEGSYNISNEEEEISVGKLAEKLVDLSGNKNIQIIYKNATEEQKSGYTNYARVGMNTDKIRNLGWRPIVTLDEGLVDTISFYNENYER